MNFSKTLLVLLVVIPIKMFAQTNTCLLKTYGYSRSVLGGVAPVNAIEPGGKEVEADIKNNKEYYVYLKTCYVPSVTITAAWINGRSYNGKAVKSKSPVILTNTTLSSKGIKETLISKTTSSIWELILSPDDTKLKPASSTQKMIKSNSLVIEGLLKGKKFIAVLKTFKELQPLAAQ